MLSQKNFSEARAILGQIEALLANLPKSTTSRDEREHLEDARDALRAVVESAGARG